jgi:hypothetical protein
MAKAQPNVDPMANRPNYVPAKDIQVPVSDDNQFPQLKLAQAISPEVTRGDEKFVPNLSAGDLLMKGAGLQRIIDGEEGLQVIPMAVRKSYVEYKPRSTGGGFVAAYNSREEAETKSDRANELQVTYDFLCIEANVEEPTPFVVRFDSPTKLGVAKKWAGYFAQYKSIEGVIYRITSKAAKNKAGQNYFNLAVTPLGWVDKTQFQFVQQLQSVIEPTFLPETTEI